MIFVEKVRKKHLYTESQYLEHNSNKITILGTKLKQNHNVGNITQAKGVRIIAPTACYSDVPLFRRPIIPTAHSSDSPFLRQPIIPSKMVKSSIIILKPVVFFYT